MSKSSSFNELFDRWGDHSDALLIPYMNGCGIGFLSSKGKNRPRMGARGFMIKTRRKVIGRAYRVYSKIRWMEGF